MPRITLSETGNLAVYGKRIGVNHITSDQLAAKFDTIRIVTPERLLEVRNAEASWFVSEAERFITL